MDSTNETTARILRVSAELIDERGIDRLSTTDVAARARVSVGTVYRYFGNRDALIRALYEENVLEVREALVAVAARSSGDVRADVHAMLEAYVHLHRTLPAYQQVRTWQWLADGTRGERRSAVQAVVRALVDILGPRYGLHIDARCADRVADAIGRADALVLVAFLDGLGHEDEGMQATLEAVEETLTRAILDALQR